MWASALPPSLWAMPSELRTPLPISIRTALCRGSLRAKWFFLKPKPHYWEWNVGGQSAKELYEQGIRLSFEQWGAEGVDQYLQVTDTRGGYSNPIHPEYSLPTFKSNVTVNWDSAAGNVEQQKAMIATQKWIALFPYNTVEACVEWRRTGYPNLLPAVSNLSGGAKWKIYTK